jgi:hypothetical protein
MTQCGSSHKSPTNTCRGGGAFSLATAATATTTATTTLAFTHQPLLFDARSRRKVTAAAPIPAVAAAFDTIHNLLPSNRRRLGGVSCLFASTTTSIRSSSSRSGGSGKNSTSSTAATVVVPQQEQQVSSSIPGKARPRRQQLVTDLKQYRIQQSAPLGKPAYTIFTNAVLDEITVRLPTSLDELLDIKGIGPKKLQFYGDDIIAMVAQYTDANGLPRRGGSGTTETTGVDTLQQQGRREEAAVSLIASSSLTTEQRHAANLLLSTERPNVFVSGRAGTGKSYLLQYVVQELQRGRRVKPAKGDDDDDDNNESTTTTMLDSNVPVKVGVCAPTGVAAIHVGGSTLHSFFGIGLGTGSLSKLIQKVQTNVEVQKRMDETDVVIIDECSMLSSHLLETLNHVVRQVRHGGKYAQEPFGGMQIICVGDFFQLPPVILL